ncbi:hypothetical protein CMO90_02245 [Candidatus Woesearchaeota archaeon]|jgi:hypothetical protein|nr:hypothetical protein [Candidatus Woesearchaeota archaeon]
MKKTLIVLVILTLFLWSCTSGNGSSVSTNYFQGSKGVEISFLPSSPPNEVYEESPYVPVGLLVSNEGSYSLNESSKGTLSYEYDNFFLKDISMEGWEDVILEGKSYKYPDGEWLDQMLPAFEVKKVPGTIQQPSTKITATICYPYKTKLSDEICIDTTPLTQDVRQKVCSLENKVYVDQGGPIAITKLEIEMQSFGGQMMRPFIRVYMENKGSGTVLSPVDDFSKACINNDRNNQNKVRIKASISGQELECNPADVSLSRGATNCYLNEGGFGAHLNYYANFLIELEYVYQSSISKNIEIIRGELPNLQPVEGCDDNWEVKVGNECVNRCEACSSGNFECGVSFSNEDWNCVSRTAIGETYESIGGFNVSANRLSKCIQDEGYCSPEKVCCTSVCLDVNSCVDYSDKATCNDDPCGLNSSCVWSTRSGGYCHH